MASRDGLRLVPWLGACFFLFTTPGLAQQPASYDVFLPLDHELRHQLDLARIAISEERYNEAVSSLGELLIGNPEGDGIAIEDYFVEPATEGSAA